MAPLSNPWNSLGLEMPTHGGERGGIFGNPWTEYCPIGSEGQEGLCTEFSLW